MKVEPQGSSNEIIFFRLNSLASTIEVRKKNKNIQVEKDNQLLIDKSDWVFLAVTPKVGNQIIGKLNFKKKQVIVSFISTIQLPVLKKLTKINRDIVRAIPLPPISLGKGPIPIFPPNKKVKQFFSHLGTVIEINNEKKSLNFGEIINYFTKNNIKILDIVTEDGDLEDVFVQLTNR